MTQTELDAERERITAAWVKEVFQPRPPVYVPWEKIQKPLRFPHTRNFGIIYPGIAYRSAQPEPEAWPVMVGGGLRAVVNTRAEEDDLAAPHLLGKYGLAYLHLPVVDERSPSWQDVAAFWLFVQNQDHWPFLIHCHGGEGRTAVFAMLLRYAWDGWSMSKGYEEARNFRRIRSQYHLDWIPILGPHFLQMAQVQQDFLAAYEGSERAGTRTPVLTPQG